MKIWLYAIRLIPLAFVLFVVLKRIKRSEQLGSINMIVLAESLKDSIDLFRALCVQQSQNFTKWYFSNILHIPYFKRKSC